MEARAPVGARPESAVRGPGGASTGGMGSERAIVSGRASAADVVSRITTVCVLFPPLSCGDMTNCMQKRRGCAPTRSPIGPRLLPA